MRAAVATDGEKKAKGAAIGVKDACVSDTERSEPLESLDRTDQAAARSSVRMDQDNWGRLELEAQILTRDRGCKQMTRVRSSD